jgi:hypothetical protein
MSTEKTLAVAELVYQITPGVAATAPALVDRFVRLVAGHARCQYPDLDTWNSMLIFTARNELVALGADRKMVDALEAEVLAEVAKEAEVAP